MTVYQAIKDINLNGSLAYAYGATVPEAVVTQYRYDLLGLVQAVPPSVLVPLPGVSAASSADLATAVAALAPLAEVRPAVAGVKAVLVRGKRSVVMQTVGDSTGDAQPEWFGLLGQSIGAGYPAYSVLWRAWSDSLQQYLKPVTLQTGPAGDRYALFNGTAGRQHPCGAAYGTATIPGDLEVEAKIMPTIGTGWKGGSSATAGDIVSHYGASGGTSWAFGIQLDGKPFLLWRDTGGTLRVATASAAVPFADGTPGWIRVTHDVDNGAAGNTATFYTSTDGTAWTILGVAQTQAFVTDHQTATDPFTIACRASAQNGSIASNYFTGRIYWVEVRRGLGGHTILPPLPEHWDKAGSDSIGTSYGGAPVVLLVSGSTGGTNSTYFTDSTRKPKILAPQGQRCLFINTGHNEVAFTWQNLIIQYFTAVLATVKAQMPGVPIVVLGQNPTIVGALRTTQTWSDDDNDVSAQLLTLAGATAGCYPLDIFPSINIATQMLDSLHPNPSGEVSWTAHMFNRLFR